MNDYEIKTKFLIEGRGENRVEFHFISLLPTEKVIVDGIKYRIKETVYDTDHKQVLYYLEEDKYEN